MEIDGALLQSLVALLREKMKGKWSVENRNGLIVFIYQAARRYATFSVPAGELRLARGRDEIVQIVLRKISTQVTVPEDIKKLAMKKLLE